MGKDIERKNARKNMRKRIMTMRVMLFNDGTYKITRVLRDASDFSLVRIGRIKANIEERNDIKNGHKCPFHPRNLHGKETESSD